ncbi:unnamed protein product, partial [Rotaria sp. Silwood1]
CPLSISTIEGLLHDAYIPGLVAIVVNSTGILYEQAIGYHSPIISNECKPMNSSNSIFVLASISKTFIAVAVMQLVELNHLNLDTDINHYLSSEMKVIHPLHPNIPITIRHLLSHTAGIKSNFEEELKHFKPNDDFTQTNLTKIISKYLNNKSNWLSESPGNVTHYSNIGPSLAALIVEHASNSSDWLYIPHYGESDYPSGSLRMSARSLAIFLQSFLNNCSSLLLNSSSVDEMLKIVRHEDSDIEFGLIWNWRIIRGRRFIGHRGAIPGVTNIMMANEKRTLGVIILSNGDISKDDDQAKKVYETIINIMLQLFDCFEEV